MVSRHRPPVGKWGEVHCAVVFIHGVGEQERGDTLMNFLSPIVWWMKKRLAPKFVRRYGTNEPEIKSYPRQGGERAYVRLTLGDHRIELTEGLWASAFRPLPNDLLIRWVARFITRMWLKNWFHFIKDILAHPNKRQVGWWHVPYEVAHSLLLILLFLPGLVLVWLLIGLLWLADTIPLPNIFPNAVASALKGVTNFFVEGFGDVAAYMDDLARRDAIRQVIEDIFEEYQANTNCTEIIVFAHSQGSVVAYDVLSRDQLRFPKCRTLITIGSVLSPVQRMYPGHSVFYKDGKKRHLQKPLRWLFFYARYDPGPPGKLSDWFQPREGSEDVEIEQVLVDNRDTIIEDHVTYSVNRDQVVSRIVDEMFHSVDLKENPYYRDKCQRKIDCKERRRRVAQLAVLRMAMYSLLLSVFGFFVWASIVNATPTAAMLNGLTTIPVIKHTFGQSVKLL